MIVNRREWIKNTSLAVSAAVLPSSGETVDRVGSLKGRIYKSVKGGQKKGERRGIFSSPEGTGI